MYPILLYLLKMLLCSGILYGYYRIALYNERFHQWNRFYLMAALLLSIMVPLFEIPLAADAKEQDLVYVIGTLPATIVARASPLITAEQFAIIGALIVSLALLARLGWGLYLTIYKPFLHGEVSSKEDIRVVITDTPSAPYSFFRLLFWRSNMDPDSPNGKRVLLHELTHIRERHSADKLFVELLLVLCWFNPFFWLIRKELYIIHEFLADRKAIEQNNGAAFAEMILQTIHSGHLSPLSNPFFSSQLKRRLKMITSSNKPQFSYLRRLSALIAMVAISAILMLNIERGMAQQAPPPPPPAPTAPPAPSFKIGLPDSIKSVKVYQKNGQNEVEVTLKNGKVRKMTMEEAEKKGYPVPPPPPPAPPAAPKPPKPTFPNDPANQAIAMEAPENDPIYIYAGLEITKAQMAMLEPGQIKSINVLKGEAAINAYGNKGKNGVIEITPKPATTVVETREVNVKGYPAKKASATAPAKTTGEVKEVVVEGYQSKKATPDTLRVLRGTDLKKIQENVMVVVNGKKISHTEMNTIDPTSITHIMVWKGADAIKKFGSEGESGVIEISTL